MSGVAEDSWDGTGAGAGFRLALTNQKRGCGDWWDGADLALQGIYVAAKDILAEREVPEEPVVGWDGVPADGPLDTLGPRRVQRMPKASGTGRGGGGVKVK